MDRHVRVSDEVRIAPLVSAPTAPALRWYQTAALDAWEAAQRRGVVALPTGAGKTHVALAAIASLAVSTLILVPTRVLLDQWVRVLAPLVPFEIGRLGDGERIIAPITIATYASAVTWAPRIGDQFGLVVVDEAHHVGGWCPSEILEMLPAPCRLGLTATPPGDEAAAHLAHFVGPTVYSLCVDELVGDGLAKLRHVTIPIELTPEERIIYRDQRTRFASVYAPYQRATHGASWQDFVRDARQTPAGRRALTAWRTYRALLAFPQGKRAALRDILAMHRGRRTLIFTGDNATAYTVARELLVQPITVEIGKAERADVLARFSAGTITALVSSQVLDEGIDVPDAEIAIVVGGTASARRHIQRIGRVLRPRDGKCALVYELAVSDSTEEASLRQRHAGLGSAASEPRGPRWGAPTAHARQQSAEPMLIRLPATNRRAAQRTPASRVPMPGPDARSMEPLVPGVSRRRSTGPAARGGVS